jgi:hypothetical protein
LIAHFIRNKWIGTLTTSARNDKDKVARLRRAYATRRNDVEKNQPKTNRYAL